ncbi:hypothetical protein ACLKA7_017125 [Drosophila subpalustris]
MTKRGTVILSSIRQLLGRSHHVRQFERSGLRLTPVTTSFVTLHRNFASSTNSSNDEQIKLEKHKKETSSNEVRSVENEKEKEIKVVWEYCDNCESQKLKDCKNLECKHRPGDVLAIRAANFTKNQKHKLMMENYEAYKKKHELEQVRAKLEREVQATDVKVALQKKTSRFQKWKANKRKSSGNSLINKMVWNVFKRKKVNQKNVATAKIQQKKNNDTQVKKFHIMAMNHIQKKSNDV